MTQETNPQPQAAGAQKPQFTLNIPEVVNLACNILHSGFIKQSEDKAKTLFKDLKEKDKLQAGTMTVGGQLNIGLTLSLDRKEFRGQFGFPVFKSSLQAMLNNIGQTINARQNLNFLTSDTGNILIHKPGVVQKGDDINVLVLVLMPAAGREMNVCLTYLDPDQYESLRKTKADNTQTTDQ